MAPEEKDKMRAVYFVPIFLILAFTWMFGQILSHASIENLLPPPPYLLAESMPTEPLAMLAPWINVLIIIAIIGTMNLIVTFLMLKRKKLFRFLKPIFLASAGFSVAAFYLDILFIQTLHRFAFLQEWMALLILPPFVGILTLYVILRKHATLLALVVLVAVGAGAAASFVSRVPFWTFLILLPALSLYDIVMVSVGCLKAWGKTMEKEPRLLHGLIVEYRGMSIGFGDIFFYSTLVAFAQLHFGIYPALLASCGILIGWYIMMLLIVKRKGIWAGLPAPLLLGGGLLFLSTLF